MDASDFYVLENPDSTDRNVTDYSKVKPVNLGEAPKCPQCNRFIGKLSWLPPFRVDLELWGNEFGDIAFGTSLDILISEKLLNAYQNNRLTGLDGLEPVEIVKIKKRKKIRQDPPNYFRGNILRSRTILDLSLSDIVHEGAVECDECRSFGLIKGINKIVLDVDSWDGKDIFISRGLYGIRIVSKKFKTVMEKNNINNEKLIPILDYCLNFYK